MSMRLLPRASVLGSRRDLRRISPSVSRAVQPVFAGGDASRTGAADFFGIGTEPLTVKVSLPADERAALSWHVQSGESVRQIAQRMKRSPEDVVLLILRGSRTLFGTRSWGDQGGGSDRDELPSY